MEILSFIHWVVFTLGLLNLVSVWLQLLNHRTEPEITHEENGKKNERWTRREWKKK